MTNVFSVSGTVVGIGDRTRSKADMAFTIRKARVQMKNN